MNWSYDLWIISTAYPGDTSGINQKLLEFPDFQVVAIMGKTEGNGCVNDFSRTLAINSYTSFFKQFEYEMPILIMSGGTEGVLSPHISAFVRRPTTTNDKEGPALTVGISHSPKINIEDIGRVSQVELVSQAVLEAMEKADIDQPEDVHFVQIKCPILNSDDLESARNANTELITNDPYSSMSYSRGASALGVAVALGEVKLSMIKNSDICNNSSIFSSVASVSAGAELKNCDVLLIGNSAHVKGSLTISHGSMLNPIDLTSLIQVLESSGCNYALKNNSQTIFKQIFAKAGPVTSVRGRRTTMYSDSDINSTRHARATVGGLISGITNETMIYVSGGAEHQGPKDGGPVALVVERKN